MGNYYLAIDIGASSGRHILGSIEDGKIVLEEIYRFENGMVEKNGHLCWNHERTFKEILAGIKKCKEIGKIPTSMSIDTWGVDFALLDENDKLLGDTVGYRDSRTRGMDEEVYKIIPEKELYARTGIQYAIFNTIYQLMAVKKEHPEQMEQAKAMLTTPDYFQFLLTGVKMQEYTMATTGQLINPKTFDWDYELIDMLGYNKEIFQKVQMPGTSVGHFTKEIQDQVGFDCEVVLCGSHDTASAVLAVPANDDDFLYISSGTWSLMGVERMQADCSPESKVLNFTNEGGYDYRFRYLKNIMGLWMLQNVRKEMNTNDKTYTFPELIAMAKEADGFPSIVNCNDSSFLAPKSMTDAVRYYCERTGQKIPQSMGEVMVVIYNSLAQSYKDTVAELEEMSGRKFTRIHVVGGGCQDMFLNQKIKTFTGKEVYAGPVEGTALGNLMVQMLKDGSFKTLEEARECVASSFDVKKVD